MSGPSGERDFKGRAGAAARGVQAGEVVALEGASVRAGSTMPLHPTTLRIQYNEFVGILGPNGAGKSTLLGLMGAAQRPSAGVVRLLGRDAWSLSEAGRAGLRSRLGVVLQRADFNPAIPLRAREVAAMGRLGAKGLAGALSRDDEAAIDEALERMGASHLAARPYRSLSGGEQQKVQLARALAQQPEVLLLDEPATGLDLDWQERLVALIGELSRSTGIALVMTTHLLSHLPPACGRAILLRDGRVLFDGPAKEGLTPARLGALYGCAVEVVERGGRRHCHAAGGAAFEEAAR